MAATTTATMLKMRELHSVLAEHGVMCLGEAADLGGLAKSSCKGWMYKLIDIGCAAQVEAPDGASKRNGVVYYNITSTPFPELNIASYGDDRKPFGVHELSRRVVKAVNMGMPRDWLVAAFFGEKA